MFDSEVDSHTATNDPTVRPPAIAPHHVATMHDMGIRVGGYTDLCLAKHLLHHLQLNAFPKHIYRGRVTKIVEAPMKETFAAHYASDAQRQSSSMANSWFPLNRLYKRRFT